MRGFGSLGSARLLAVGVALCLAGCWAAGTRELLPAGQRPDIPVSPVAAAEPAQAAAAGALEARCSLAMIRGTCRVMKPAADIEPSQRIFVAGAGEVDSRVYAELRRQGDEMCGAVRRHCEQEWDGSACRIARALYPEAVP